MKHLWVVVIASVAASAIAKPLPPGLAITIKSDHLVATQGGVTVPLFTPGPSGSKSYSGPVTATLSDDGKTVLITAGDCMGHGSGDPPREVPLAAINAKFENTAGMQLLAKKKYADAILHFTAAAQADLTTPMYATNLLSAQSLAGKLDDADKTLATYGPSAIAWFGWRLAVDSDLKSLAGRASTKPFFATPPTQITFDPDKSVAVSPLGLIAVGEWIAVGQGPRTSEVGIYDVKTNRRVLTLPVAGFEDACADKDNLIGLPACTKAIGARVKAHAAAVDALLRRFGFADRKAAWIEPGDDANVLVSPDKSISIALRDGNAIVTHGKKTVSLKDVAASPRLVGWAGDLVVLQFKEPYDCGGMDSVRSSIVVIAVP